MTIWCLMPLFFPYPNKWHFSWQSTKARIISNKPYFRYWWSACDMIWLTSIGSQQHERKRYLYAQYIVGVWFTLIIKHTKATAEMAKEKWERQSPIQLEFINLAIVHVFTSDAISIEDIDFLLLLLLLLLFDGLIPSSRIFSHPHSQSLFVSSLLPDFRFDSFSAHGNSFSLILHYSCMRERSTFCNAITYWLWTRDNRSFCSKSNGFLPCQM